MKRSIQNKLISQSLVMLMMEIALYNSGLAWRIIIGPLNPNICLFVLFVHNFFGIVVAVCITEIISFKVFMLYDWTYFCSMDEVFLSQTILTFNFLFGFCTQYCRWMLGSLETHGYELLSGVLLSNKSINHKRYFWPISFVIYLTIFLVGILALNIKSIRYTSLTRIGYKKYISHLKIRNQTISTIKSTTHHY